jgi:hypothetical protein
LIAVCSTSNNLIGLRFRRTVSSLRGRSEIRQVMLLRIIEPGLSPEHAGNLNRIDAGGLPPRLLIASPVHGAMMGAAERDGEFVARFAAERARLQVSKMMRIGLFAAAHETRLLGDIAKVLPVAVATRGSDCENTLVDALRFTSVGVGGSDHLGRSNLGH